MTSVVQKSQPAEGQIRRATGVMRITRVAAELGVSPQYLRILEWQGRIPPARRDFKGRVYGEADLALLRNMGIGSRPLKLKPPEEVIAGSS